MACRGVSGCKGQCPGSPGLWSGLGQQEFADWVLAGCCGPHRHVAAPASAGLSQPSADAARARAVGAWAGRASGKNPAQSPDACSPPAHKPDPHHEPEGARGPQPLSRTQSLSPHAPPWPSLPSGAAQSRHGSPWTFTPEVLQTPLASRHPAEPHGRGRARPAQGSCPASSVRRALRLVPAWTCHVPRALLRRAPLTQVPSRRLRGSTNLAAGQCFPASPKVPTLVGTGVGKGKANRDKE